MTYIIIASERFLFPALLYIICDANRNENDWQPWLIFISQHFPIFKHERQLREIWFIHGGRSSRWINHISLQYIKIPYQLIFHVGEVSTHTWQHKKIPKIRMEIPGVLRLSKVTENLTISIFYHFTATLVDEWDVVRRFSCTKNF